MVHSQRWTCKNIHLTLPKIWKEEEVEDPLLEKVEQKEEDPLLEKVEQKEEDPLLEKLCDDVVCEIVCDDVCVDM